MSLAWDLGIVSLFGITAGIWAGVALLDIHVSSFLQVWSGCWFFTRHPNFPFSALLQFGVRLVRSFICSERIRCCCDPFVFIGMRHATDSFILRVGIGTKPIHSLSRPFMRSSSLSPCSLCAVFDLHRILLRFHRIGLNRHADPFFKPSVCSRRGLSSSSAFKWTLCLSVFIGFKAG